MVRDFSDLPVSPWKTLQRYIILQIAFFLSPQQRAVCKERDRAAGGEELAMMPWASSATGKEEKQARCVSGDKHFGPSSRSPERSLSRNTVLENWGTTGKGCRIRDRVAEGRCAQLPGYTS
jgi:hypothetical protein